MFAALILGQPDEVVLAALVFFGVVVVGVILIIGVVRILSSRKNMAILAELTELRAETARLREENEQLRKGRDVTSTGIRDM